MGYYADLLNAKSIQLTVFGKNYTIKDANDIYGIRTEITSERTKRIRAGENESSVNKEFDEANNKLKKIYELFPRDYDSKEKQEKDFAKLKSIVNSKEESMGYYADLIKQKQKSKEEKDNSLIGLFDDLRPKDEKTVKEYIRQVKNFIRQCETKSERSDYAKDYRDLNKRAAESYKKDVEKAERWLAEHHNSKEEKQNFDMGYFRKMYDELQELKRKGIKGANIDKYYAAINQYKEAEEYMKLYKETGKSYHKASADSLKREADRWMREVKESIHNSDEEKGYYAKLAEEKASRKN